MSEDLTKQLSGDDLVRFLIGDLKGSMDRRLDDLSIVVLQRTEALRTEVLQQIEALRTELLQQIESLSVETHQQIAGVISRVDALEEKVDRRLMETRPIWESVQATLSEIQTSIRRLERQISELGNDILRLRVDQRDLEDRINKLSPA